MLVECKLNEIGACCQTSADDSCRPINAAFHAHFYTVLIVKSRWTHINQTLSLRRDRTHLQVALFGPHSIERALAESLGNVKPKQFDFLISFRQTEGERKRERENYVNKTRQVTIKGGNWFQKPIQAEHHRELAHQNRTLLISLTCTEAREHTHAHTNVYIHQLWLQSNEKF